MLPSALDTASLDEFVEKNTRDITKLHERIRGLYTTIQQICVKAAQLSSTVLRKQHLVNTAKSFRAPIRRIPPEVLSMVFSMCRESDTCDNRTGRLLSQVSGIFREVALSTPSLWDSHRVDLGDLHDGSPSNSARFLKLVKDRSSGRSLSLDIAQKSPGPSHPDPLRVPALMKSLSFSLPSFTTLRLDVPFPTLISAFSDFGRETAIFDSLEFLTLRIRKPTGDANTLTMFNKSPKLRAVSLSLEKFDVSTTAICLPSMPLRVFGYQATYDGDEIFGNYMVPWRKSIHECLALERLNLAFGYHPDFDEYLDNPPFLDDESFESEIIDLPHLQAIEVVNELSGRVCSIFSKIKFTGNLEVLRFEAKSQPCIITSDDRDFFPKMYCTLSALSDILPSLTSLSLVHVVISDDDLSRLFIMTPNLSHLEILNIAEWHEIDRKAAYRRPDNERLIQVLRDINHLPGALLPRLVSLVLYVPDQRNESFQDTVEEYTTMAKKRTELNASRNVSSTESKSYFKLHLHFFKESVKDSDNIDMLQFDTEMQKIRTDSRRFKYTYDVLERFINSR